MSTPTTGMRFVGQRVPRSEDARFLTGQGEYVDDVYVPGTLHAAFARSDIARGKLLSVDVSGAREIPGVRAVYVAADLNAKLVDFHVDGEAMSGLNRPFRVLAEGDVRHVGEAVAMVVADSRYIAEDAVDAIAIDIEAEEPILDPIAAAEPGARVVHPGTESNILSALPMMDNPALDEAIANAAVVVTETVTQHRYLTVPMETRAILANWESRREQLTVHLATQGPHGARSLFARVLGIDESQVRVIMPDVGGSFGLKMNARVEEIATVLATHLLGQPVKWTQDRRENLVADEQPREDSGVITIAAEADGTLVATKAEFTEMMGAFPAAFSSASILSTMIFTGPYRIPFHGASAKAVHTNHMGRGSYRGPWMFETVAREQVLDILAHELGMDPLELRRKNALSNAEMPYAMPTGMAYDQLTALECLEKAAEVIEYDKLREQQAQWRAEGRYVGIGVSLFPEPTAMAFGWMSTDAAVIKITGSGRVDVQTTVASHGQSLETTIAQVVADELGVDFSQVRVRQGDTDSSPVGPGTGGSRSTVIPTTAARIACAELRERILAIVAHTLEASVDDLEIERGRVQVKGTPDKGMSFADVAAKAYSEPMSMPPGIPLGLEAQARFTPPSYATWANACHICVVEVDIATGGVEILRYLVSEDCGVMINPNVVEGQIAGGVVQGIGGVLLENLAYDEAGNPLATTFVDYLLPTATEVPDLEYTHVETFAPSNPGGHKGLGEGGAIGSPPAVVNAVLDALRPLGVERINQPLGPADVVRYIEAAAAR
jgi:carbon-monoxide dehydrogenase large subunit